MKLNKTSLIWFLIFLSWCDKIHGDGDDIQSTTPFKDDKNTTMSAAEARKAHLSPYCKDLIKAMGEVGDNWTLCCVYPDLFAISGFSDDKSFDDIFVKCYNECNFTFYLESWEAWLCCYRICILREVGFLLFSTDPNIMPQTNVQGVINIYMTSVQNDPAWEPIIRSSVNRCFDEANAFEFTYECGVIPSSLKFIYECCFIEQFLKCPYWNPDKREECPVIYKYNEECASAAMYVMLYA